MDQVDYSANSQKRGKKHYGPISLMTTIYKIFSKIILDRLTERLDEKQPRAQMGFRTDFSTVDHIHVVKQVVEKYNEYALASQGIENKYIRLIRNIYNNSTAKVKLERIGEEFEKKKGVRQGDSLSPKLFLAVLEEIFRNLQWEELGINVNGCKLRFADDLVLFTDDPDTLQEMLNLLASESRKAGLTINTSKAKVMTKKL
ncbi:jg24530 [Pararge aegeria aegeria]|uniref:Jg24530 protein n=1 Tax=Pararge aegeria aegeria TaxID=348720 RepID=A0A8S4R246_9NEOP|nr:jg24530 [Pararge aegeria aegeria]